MFLTTSFLLFNTINADVKVRQVFVACGGVFEPENYVTLGTFDPETGVYKVFDSIQTVSANDMIISGDDLFVAADSFLIRYDINTLERLAQNPGLKGINNLAVTDDFVFVSRWQSETNSYVQIYDRNDLSFIHEFSEIDTDARSMVVVDNFLYVAVPGDWTSTSGQLAIINIENKSFVKMIQLGDSAAGISNVFSDGNFVYSINTINWMSDYGTILHYDISNESYELVTIEVPLKSGTKLWNNEIHGVFDQGMGIYNTNTKLLTDTNLIEMYINASAIDTLNNKYYLAETDFFSYGKVLVFDLNGSPLDTFETGISPEAIVVHYVEETVGLEILKNNLYNQAVLYPNPANDFIYVKNNTDQKFKYVEILDLNGRLLAKFNNADNELIRLDISGIEKGSYIVKLIKFDNSYYYDIMLKK